MPLLPLLEMIDEDSYILEVETDLQKYWRSKFLFYAEKLTMITGYGVGGGLRVPDRNDSWDGLGLLDCACQYNWGT